MSINLPIYDNSSSKLPSNSIVAGEDVELNIFKNKSWDFVSDWPYNKTIGIYYLTRSKPAGNQQWQGCL